MKTLIITLCNNQIDENIFNLFGAAHKITTVFDVLAIGSADNVTNISQYANIDKVIHLNKQDNLHPENIAPIIAKIASQYTHILIAANSFGKNLLPRIAGMLQIGQISEIVDIVSPNIFKRFGYAGNALFEIESLENIKLLSVRTTNFAPIINKINQNANIEVLQDDKFIDQDNRIQIISTQINNNDKIDLATAQIVVSGGRSLINKDNFDNLIRQLASKLNAAVGATRAAVEAGLSSNDTQVGQTGKIVAPKVYIAVGVSGAVQHIAGMKGSQIVIAINSDDSAPIFEHANYGIIGDLFEIVPQLINKL